MARELLPAGNAANPLVLTLIIISVPGSGGGLNRVLLGLDWKLRLLEVYPLLSHFESLRFHTT